MGPVEIWHPGLVLLPSKLTPEIILNIKGSLSPAQTLALTVWAEARSRLDRGRWISNPLDAMVDVMNVIDNRVRDLRWSKLGHKRVCLQRWQFSCWEPFSGPDDKNDADLYAENFEDVIARAQEMIARFTLSEKLANCLAAAEGCLAGRLVDALSGACHYYADWMRVPPKWSFHKDAKLVAHRHGHLFFANVP